MNKITLVKQKYCSVYNAAFFGGSLSLLITLAMKNTIGWVILHTLCGWFYVLYWACKYSIIPDWIVKHLVNVVT